MSFSTPIASGDIFSVSTSTLKVRQPTIPDIVISPPSAEDIPCLTNKSPRRAVKFLGKSRQRNYALSMPPLKGMPQPLRPVVVNVRVASLGSQAVVCTDPAEERYIFPTGPNDNFAIVNKNSDVINNHDGPSSPRIGFSTPKFSASIASGNLDRVRPRRNSGILTLRHSEREMDPTQIYLP